MFVVLLVPNLPGVNFDLVGLGEGAAKLIVLFYAIELILRDNQKKWSLLRFGTMTALAVMSLRGVL